MTPQNPMAFNSTLQTMEDPILVVDYDADWPLLYEQEKSHIFDAFGNTVADIQHIGSTSVPGLAAKPVIDILLGVEHIPPQTSQIADPETLGYLYCGELGIPRRHYFRLLNAPHPSNSLSEVDG